MKMEKRFAWSVLERGRPPVDTFPRMVKGFSIHPPIIFIQIALQVVRERKGLSGLSTLLRSSRRRKMVQI
jgi:hypothetical protein